MFLTEGKTLNTGYAVSASPTTGWQMLYESEMVWHKLEMGMTRLEHSAIVREDHGLLQEGVKEFFTKAKKWFQWAGQEFLRYLDKVIDTWTNIQNKIRTWLINVEDLKKKVRNKEVKISARYKKILASAQKIALSSQEIKVAVDTIRDAADKAAKDNDGNYEHSKTDAAVGAALAKFKTDFGSGFEESGYGSGTDAYRDVFLEEKEAQAAINFAKDGRIKCIKTLQYARNSFAKLINMGIRDADAEKEDVKKIKRASSQMRELLNKWISLVNKATNAVISAIGKAKAKGTGKSDATKQDEADLMDEYDKRLFNFD